MFVLPVNCLQLHFQRKSTKAIIARKVDRDPDLLIVKQPTRGLDVGAIEYIHKRLIEERDNGKAVLVVSFELDEILNVSDRLLLSMMVRFKVLYHQKQPINKSLVSWMAGGNLGKEEEWCLKLQQISVPWFLYSRILLGAIVMWIFGYDAIWGYREEIVLYSLW